MTKERYHPVLSRLIRPPQFATWAGAGSAPTLLAYYCYADNLRAKKIVQTGPDTWQVTVYVDGVFEHRYEVGPGGQPPAEQTQVLVHDGHRQLYQRRSGAALGDQRPDQLYSLDDHLGSAVAQSDAQGAIVSREEYYPFGETSFGSTAKQRYRFCGKERDEESGLYYYGMRYYAPWICRFVSVDPLAAQYDYLTPYQYASNRPITHLDVDGLEETLEGVETKTPTEDFFREVENYSGYRELVGILTRSPTSTSRGSGSSDYAPIRGYSTPGISFKNFFPERIPDLYLFKVDVDISKPKVSQKIYEASNASSIVRQGQTVEYLTYAQYSGKYDQVQQRAKTAQAIATSPFTKPEDQFKGYKYYRAMSWEEYEATGGLLNDRRTSGEGPNITSEVSYVENAKFIIANPVKYGLIVKYNSTLSPQNLDATPFTYNTLARDGNGAQLPGGPVFRAARAVGMWYKKIEGNRGKAYSFPGTSTETFNSSLLTPPKAHSILSPKNASK